jgi:hypothetical protein
MATITTKGTTTTKTTTCSATICTLHKRTRCALFVYFLVVMLLLNVVISSSTNANRIERSLSSSSFTCPLPDNKTTINETYLECQKVIQQNNCTLFSISSYYARYYVCHQYMPIATTTIPVLQATDGGNDNNTPILFNGCWENDVSYEQCQSMINSGCTVIDSSYNYLNRYVCYDSEYQNKFTCPTKNLPCTNTNTTRQCNLLLKQGCQRIIISQSTFPIESITDACSIDYRCIDNTDTTNITATTIATPEPPFQCPIVSGECITEETVTYCQQLVNNGCQLVVTSNTCPVQFFCADDAYDTIFNSTNYDARQNIQTRPTLSPTILKYTLRNPFRFKPKTPSATPSAMPLLTSKPSMRPKTTYTPSIQPKTTTTPSIQPKTTTSKPKITSRPTSTPADKPTWKPRTVQPKTTTRPTLYPIKVPTLGPTKRPKRLPTNTPTNTPTYTPTNTPITIAPITIGPTIITIRTENDNDIFPVDDNNDDFGTPSTGTSTPSLDTEVTLLIYADMGCLGEPETSLTFVTYSQPNDQCCKFTLFIVLVLVVIMLPISIIALFYQ